MKYNKDGSRCLRQIRRELAGAKHSVYKEGSNWIMSRSCGDHNRVQPDPYWATERDAIEILLGHDPPSSQLIQYKDMECGNSR